MLRPSVCRVGKRRDEERDVVVRVRRIGELEEDLEVERGTVRTSVSLAARHEFCPPIALALALAGPTSARG